MGERYSTLDEFADPRYVESVMSAILDLLEVRQCVSPLSVEDYHPLGEYDRHGKRTKLIRGILIEKMSKSPLHRAQVYSRLENRCYQETRVAKVTDALECSSVPGMRIPVAELFG